MSRVNIFIAAPLTDAGRYSYDQQFQNYELANEAFLALAADDFAPYSPNHVWFSIRCSKPPSPHDLWQTYLGNLMKSDIVLRLPGSCRDADEFCSRAIDWRIPVMKSVEELRTWSGFDPLEAK